ncbi:hypothetical protein V8C35DRAFT_293317 [Trichoderma chlorosporum]
MVRHQSTAATAIGTPSCKRISRGLGQTDASTPASRNRARFDGPHFQDPKTRIGSQSRDADTAGPQVLEQEPPPPASDGYPETPPFAMTDEAKRSVDVDAASPKCRAVQAAPVSRPREALSLINLRPKKTKRGNEGSLANLDLHKALGS